MCLRRLLQEFLGEDNTSELSEIWLVVDDDDAMVAFAAESQEDAEQLFDEAMEQGWISMGGVSGPYKISHPNRTDSLFDMLSNRIKDYGD